MANSNDLVNSAIRPTAPKEDYEKEIKEIKNGLKITRGSFSTYLIVLAINKIPENNKIQQIGPGKGHPIEPCVYNNNKASYEASCTASQPLGIIKASYFAEYEGCNWNTPIPMPEVVLKRYMTATHKSHLKKFKANFPEKEFTYEFIQFIFN